MLLSINCIGLSYWISKLILRISDLERAAYGLMLIDAYINGQFLTEVQEFQSYEDESNENGN